MADWMSEDGWEPWRTEGRPVVGDYIQAEIGCVCSKREKVEGIVYKDNPHVRLIPKFETNLCVPHVERWRRRKPPGEVIEEEREKELEKV